MARTNTRRRRAAATKRPKTVAGKASIEDRLIASAREALAISRGEAPAAQRYTLPLTARTATVPAPKSYTREDVQRIREQLGVSQDLFAQLLAKSAPTVRSWEQGQREPDPAANRLLQIAETHPDILLELVVRK